LDDADAHEKKSTHLADELRGLKESMRELKATHTIPCDRVEELEADLRVEKMATQRAIAAFKELRDHVEKLAPFEQGLLERIDEKDKEKEMLVDRLQKARLALATTREQLTVARTELTRIQDDVLPKLAEVPPQVDVFYRAPEIWRFCAENFTTFADACRFFGVPIGAEQKRCVAYVVFEQGVLPMVEEKFTKFSGERRDASKNRGI
jgi:hypothetical protein